MARLLEGRWVTGSMGSMSHDEKGRFVRGKTTFRQWIKADGSTDFAPEAGRYHLYVSWACPWAHRTIIMRKLKRLENAVSLAVTDAFMGDDGWTFAKEPGSAPDPVNELDDLKSIYLRADPKFTGRVTVPVLWDTKTRTIVNNESQEIMRMFDREFGELADCSVDLCPAELESDVDAAIDALFNPVNNGVYRAGFARSQEAYDEAVSEVFEALDHWESVLGEQRYLCGNTFTEADICMFTTLVRFDLVYHYHFKCNVRRITDYANLWGFTRDVYQKPGIAELCNFDHIRRHYYRSHESINPHRVIPKGPIVDFTEAHDRDRFG